MCSDRKIDEIDENYNCRIFYFIFDEFEIKINDLNLCICIVVNGCGMVFINCMIYNKLMRFREFFWLCNDIFNIDIF